MGDKKSKFSSFVLATLLLLVVYLFFAYIKAPEPGVKINFFDVGQGDAALIINNHNQSILIDGGPNEAVLERISDALPFYQHKITTVILTHPHADHLNGLIDVMQKYEINNIYSTGVIHTTPEYIEFLTLTKEKNINFKTLKSGDKLTYEDGLELEILFPSKNLVQKKVDNLNNTSIVVKMNYGEINSLFMGDLEPESQDEILARGADLSAEIIKVPHHGSKDSVNLEFIEKVKPAVSIFSVGKDNRFNHPAQSALAAYGFSKIYRTDQDGSIQIAITKEKIVKIETN